MTKIDFDLEGYEKALNGEKSVFAKIVDTDFGEVDLVFSPENGGYINADGLIIKNADIKEFKADDFFLIWGAFKHCYGCYGSVCIDHKNMERDLSYLLMDYSKDMFRMNNLTDLDEL